MHLPCIVRSLLVHALALSHRGKEDGAAGCRKYVVSVSPAGPYFGGPTTQPSVTLHCHAAVEHSDLDLLLWAGDG